MNFGHIPVRDANLVYTEGCIITLGELRATPNMHESFYDFLAQHSDRSDETLVMLGPYGPKIEEIN